MTGPVEEEVPKLNPNLSIANANAKKLMVLLKIEDRGKIHCHPMIYNVKDLMLQKKIIYLKLHIQMMVQKISLKFY